MAAALNVPDGRVGDKTLREPFVLLTGGKMEG
jgi:hypothetical protein